MCAAADKRPSQAASAPASDDSDDGGPQGGTSQGLKQVADRPAAAAPSRDAKLGRYFTWLGFWEPRFNGFKNNVDLILQASATVIKFEK